MFVNDNEFKKIDYYALLGVDRNADKATLKKAFKKLLQHYHPDLGNVPTATAENMQKLLNDAREILIIDNGKKARYDAFWDKNFKNKKRGNKMENNNNNNNNTTALARRQETQLSTERIPVIGRTDAPIEPPKKNHKKIYLIVAGVLITVTIAGSSILLANSLSHNNDDKQQDPSLGQQQDSSLGQSQNQEKIDLEEEITKNASIVYKNWMTHGIECPEETVVEIIKTLNGLDSSLSIDQVDEILMTVLNTSITPGLNNVLAGESNTTKEIDFASLILDDQEGLEAVEHMEDNLNGCLTDPSNMISYCEDAFIDEALIIGEESTVDGMSSAEDTTTPAGVRLVWSRLTLGVNAFAGTLGDELNAEVLGRTYLQSDLNDGVKINEIANTAKKELGSYNRAITLS